MRFFVPILAAAALTTGAHAADPTLKFSYTYPAQARAIPALKAWLDRDAAASRAKMLADATKDRRDAAKENRPFHPYEADRTWKVVTDTPRFLSLSLEAYDYTGGAHGNTAFDTLLWDKTANRRFASTEPFASKAALAAAVRPTFCARLDAERRTKRAGQDSGDIPEFTQCSDPAKQTVILGSSNGKQFTRIGFLIAPYEAGPYAEGTYDVTVLVTPQIIATVKPQWRRYFAVTVR